MVKKKKTKKGKNLKKVKILKTKNKIKPISKLPEKKNNFSGSGRKT